MAETLQKVDGRSEAAQAIFAQRAPHQAPDANGLVALRRGGREAIRNRLEQALEPFRFDTPENLLPEHEVAQRADRLRRVHIVDDLREQFIAGLDRARDGVEEPAIVE